MVVLATGSREFVPDLPGVDNPIVGTMDAFLSGSRKAGKKVAVIGGHYGAEIAVSLARDGKSEAEGYTKYHRPPAERMHQAVNAEKIRVVTLIEEGPMMGWPPFSQVQRFTVINEFLAEAGVNCLVQTSVKQITDTGLVCRDAGGKEIVIEADTVILALPRLPNRDLYHQLAGTGIQMREIGDCAGPEKVEKAIHMANYLARQI